METSLSDEWAFNLSRHKFLRSNPIFFFAGELTICKVCNRKKKKSLSQRTSTRHMKTALITRMIKNFYSCLQSKSNGTFYGASRDFFSFYYPVDAPEIHKRHYVVLTKCCNSSCQPQNLIPCMENPKPVSLTCSSNLNMS